MLYTIIVYNIRGSIERTIYSNDQPSKHYVKLYIAE